MDQVTGKADTNASHKVAGDKQARATINEQENSI